ncbi:MAG: putative sulfate/molybdate transporter [Planctomycetota bacterium]
MTTPSPTMSRRALRFDRAEAGGALGDLGTFIPLLVAMVYTCGLQLGPALLAAGVLNILTGVVFRIPMPVQPMKAIATVAIAEKLSESQILCAGMVTGGLILLAGLTGLIDHLNRAVPKSVVRGLQLAMGLKLLTSGYEMIARCDAWIGSDSVALGIACAVLVLALYFSSRIPGALVVFGIGLAALLIRQPALLGQTQLGMSWRLPSLGSGNDWLIGTWRGALPQLPLTTLNSVIAVCALAKDLFPHSDARPGRVAVSVGLMNLLTCPLGGMPMCHGAGGLAGQYRFGARTGGSVILLGAVKCLLAVALGDSLLQWLQAYPQSVLGVLLLFSGLELSMACRDQSSRVDFFVLLLTAGACLAINMAAGFVIGWSLAAALLWGWFRIEPPADSSDPRA